MCDACTSHVAGSLALDIGAGTAGYSHMPARNMTGGEHPAGAPMLSIERASSPVRLESAAPSFRNTTAAIYPAKPSRQEPSKAANRAVSAAFCDVPDPRYARVEAMRSQIALGAAADVASVASSDLGGGSPKVGTTVRVATAEDLQSGKPRRRVAARSRSSRASTSGGGAAGDDDDDARSVRSCESGSVRSYYSEGGGSQRSRGSYAPSQVSNASTASTILRARVAELERENAVLKDRPAPGRGDQQVWQAGEPVASGITRRADLFASDGGAFVHEGQSASAEERGCSTHQEAAAVGAGYFPDTPPEVFEAKIAAKFQQATEKQLKNRHLSSSIQLAHDDGGGVSSGHSPRKALVARRSKANPVWEGGTPPQQRGGGAAGPDRRAGGAGATSDSMSTEKMGIERPSAEAKGGRRALDNTSQFTIGAATGGGGVDLYQVPAGEVGPVATKKSVESMPALMASGPRWASTLRDAPGSGRDASLGSDAFQLSMSNGRGR